MKRPALLLLFITASVSHAIVDSNQNGISDLWEKQHNNGQLFPSSFDPQADDDGDGRANALEATAGTDPGNGIPPAGFFAVEITHSPAVYLNDPDGGDPQLVIPEAFLATWSALPGKQYTLFATPDLSPGSWLQIGPPIVETGPAHDVQIAVTPEQTGGGLPDKLFWRVGVEDIDSDGDALSNAEEAELGTNPHNPDTDLDGILDGADPTPLSNNAIADPDGENPPAGGTSNLRGFWDFESQAGTTYPAVFPDRSGANRHASSSGPGPQPLGIPSRAGNIGPNHITITYDMDTKFTIGSLYPGHAGSSFPDARIDRLRVHSKMLTQPEVAALYHQDTDRDGLWDITETNTRYSDYQGTLVYHPDPADPAAPQPTQTGHARSPFLHSSGALDFDQDELNDLAEQTAGTSLTKPDTDDDNLTDGFEVFNNFNPLSAFSLGPDGPRDDLGDPDSDTLTTLTESLNGSNPRNANSDGDTTNDAAEIAQGSDPGNAADSGAAPTDPPEPVAFHIYGDYTAWEANIKGKGPHDTRTRRFRMSAPDAAADQTLNLLRGNAYELSLRYIRTKPGESVPWYCWETTIAGKTTPAFTVANHWIVDNNSALLAAHTHSHGTNQVADKKVNLLPVEVNSMDRYLSGSIPESMIENFGGESKFGLVFRNPSSGETYSFNKLSEAHVYDDPFGATDEDEDKFLSNSEIAAWANGPSSASKELTQDVVFYRKDGKLHFRTIFDQAGAIEIGLIKDGQEIGKIDWTLKPDAQIADLLETVDSILSGNYDDGGGIVVAAMQAGLSGEDLNALQSAAASIQSSSSSFGGFLRRNLTIKINIHTWEALKGKFEEGARKAGAAVDRAITIATFAGKGFCEGAWLGVKDDATSLVELGKMILNPAETAKTFYEGFKVLIELDLEGWKNVGKSLAQSFLEKGTEGVGEWGEPNAIDVASYLVGFTAGFITEQIAVTYVTAGILKAGNVGAKIGQFIRKASQGLLNGLAETAGNLIRRQAMKAKNSLFRRFSQDVLSTEDVKKLKHMLQELELLCPL